MKKVILTLSISLMFCIKLFAQNSDSLPKGFINEKVNIAGIVSGDISKEAMLNSKGLSFDDMASLTYHITAFKLTMIIRDATPKAFSNEKNGELTTEMRNAIKSAPVGSKIYFEYIKCADKNNLAHSLYATSFIIK